MNKHPVTPEQLALFIQLTHARYMVALIILFGMVAIAIASVCMVLRLRKTGFLFLGVYGGLMSFLGIGFCYIFGPIVLAASLAGLAREWFSGPSKNQSVLAGTEI